MCVIMVTNLLVHPMFYDIKNSQQNVFINNTLSLLLLMKKFAS